MGHCSVDCLGSAGVAMVLAGTWRVGWDLEGLRPRRSQYEDTEGSEGEESRSGVHIGKPSSDLDSWPLASALSLFSNQTVCVSGRWSGARAGNAQRPRVVRATSSSRESRSRSGWFWQSDRAVQESRGAICRNEAKVDVWESVGARFTSLEPGGLRVHGGCRPGREEATAEWVERSRAGTHRGRERAREEKRRGEESEGEGQKSEGG